MDASEGARKVLGSTSKVEEGGAADDRPGMDFVGPVDVACDGSGGDFIVAMDDEDDSVEALFSSSGSSLISGGGALSPFMLDM